MSYDVTSRDRLLKTPPPPWLDQVLEYLALFHPFLATNLHWFVVVIIGIPFLLVFLVILAIIKTIKKIKIKRKKESAKPLGLFFGEKRQTMKI